MTSSPRTIALSLTEGTAVRDLLQNGLLQKFTEANYNVALFTEAARVPAFVRDWSLPGVEIVHYNAVEPSESRSRAYFLRKRLVKLGNRALLTSWIRMEERRYYQPSAAMLETFRRIRPSVFVGTNANLVNEWEMISAAHASQVPTLSLVRSWDNVHKGLRSRPQNLAVWSETNRQEAIAMEAYQPDEVTITGGPQFDGYFSKEARWSREKLAEHFELDPARPILVFASFGYYKTSPEETCWMDLLIKAIEENRIPGRPQIICRLHPMSRLEHFHQYRRHPDVRLSHVTRYYPTLNWYMTRDDVVVVGNMLRHADVVITPGSTFTLEGAIFDRPTIVPLFHTYQTERSERYFTARTLGRHFGRLERLDLVPILRKEQDFVPAINRALEQPEWYRDQRCQIVKDYIHFTDGRSTERVAELAMRLASERQ